MATEASQPGTIIARASRVRRIFRFWLWLFGIFWSAGILISLIKGGFAIELHGLPLKIFEQYVWLRDALFEPVVWALRYFGLTMPWWLKDLLMAYALGAGATWRASAYDWVTAEPLIGPEGRKVLGMLKPSKNIGLRIMRTVAWWLWLIFQLYDVTRWQKARNELRPDWSGLCTAETGLIRDQYRGFLLNVILAVLAALAFFVWNNFQNVFGPPG